MRVHLFAAACLALACTGSAAAAEVAGFDDLPLAPGSFFDPDTTTTFTSGGISFNHNTPFGACCWEAWTYSNGTDTTTPGFGNQTSAITGGGIDGPGTNYGVAFTSTTGAPARASFAGPRTVQGAWFTNTTYAYFAVRDGDDGNNPPFVSGPFGEDDFFRLSITGLDASDTPTGSVDFLLADGTAIVDAWTWVDLTGLGEVVALEFALSSSDVGSFGMNTPAYFAMDDLTVVPLPASVVLFAPLAGFLLRRRRA